MPLTGYNATTSPTRIIKGPAILRVGGVNHAASRGVRAEFTDETINVASVVDGLVANMAGGDYIVSRSVRITGTFFERGQAQVAREQGNTVGVLAGGVTTFTPHTPGTYQPGTADWDDVEVLMEDGGGDLHRIVVAVAHVTSRSIDGTDGVALTLEARSTDPDVVPYVHTITPLLTGVLVSDTFTRADTLTPLGNADTGQAWTAHVGDWGISTNRAYITSGGGAYKIATIDSGAADVAVAVDISGSILGGPGIAFRYTDATNFWIVDFAGAGARIVKQAAGVFTVPLDVAHAWTTGDTIEVRGIADALTLWVNGVQLGGTVTDAFNATATRHGMVGINDFTVFYDNFSVTAL